MKSIITTMVLAGCGWLLMSVEVDGRGFGGRGGGGFGGGGRGGFGGGGFGGGERGGGGSGGGGRGGGGGFGGGERGGGERGGGFGGGGDRSGGGERGGGSRSGGFSGGERGGGSRSGGFGGGERGGAGAGFVGGGGERGGERGGAGAGFMGGGGERGAGAMGGGGQHRVGPYGRPAGGEAARPGGGAQNWQSAFGGAHSPTDMGMAHYSSLGAAGVNSPHATTFHSASYTNAQAAAVRGNFSNYNCFHPNWNTAHPGAWYAAGWSGASAWQAATYPSVAAWCGLAAGAISSGGSSDSADYDYDYGNSVVYQNNNVYMNGQDVGTAQNFNQQAASLADQGQKANAPPDEEWKAIGVFALTQGDDKSSNNIFQIAVNKDGILRGNYYDGLMDTTTPVYGSVDKKSQRAAWTIGKSKNRVFEAGIYNLTKSETPVLVHIGTDRTQQMLLVRVEQPKNGK